MHFKILHWEVGCPLSGILQYEISHLHKAGDKDSGNESGKKGESQLKGKDERQVHQISSHFSLIDLDYGMLLILTVEREVW